MANIFIPKQQHPYSSIPLCGDGGGDAVWILKAKSVLVCLAGHLLHAIAPRPPHTAAVSVSGKGRGAAKLGERRASTGSLPESSCFVPGMGRDPQDKAVPNIFGGVSLQEIAFRIPYFGFPFVCICMEGFFSGDGTLSPLPVIHNPYFG